MYPSTDAESITCLLQLASDYPFLSKCADFLRCEPQFTQNGRVMLAQRGGRETITDKRE